jgi:3-hydroxy-3-methylglutaryl CoA synthase
MMKVGIEKIRVYPTSLKVDLTDLALARGYDVAHMHNELMVKERGLNPVWEDAVTMAVNAAKPLLSQEDLSSIGLLIVGTETGLDQEKSLSSWVHHYLDLPSNCRHFEIKGACYSGTAGLKMAAAWITSGMAKSGQKALVITTDQSLNAINLPWEYVGGGASVAMLISDKPDLVVLENEKSGVYAHEVSDVIRPLPWIETGNSENSLFSYMEGLLGSYDDYISNLGPVDFNSFFKYNIYHVPFSGISYRAHKQLLQANIDCTKEEVLHSFHNKTKPSLHYTSRIGASYGGSVFIALLGLLKHAKDKETGDRIGIFSYGSGSCAEYYSVLIGENADQVVEAAGLDELIDQREAISITNYEIIENLRVEMSQSANFTPDFSLGNNIYTNQYEGKGKLIFKASKNYYRYYEFS